MLYKNFRTDSLVVFEKQTMLGACKKIVVGVDEICLQEPNIKSIVPQQLKFLRNKNSQT